MAVVGAGLIGCELANDLALAGHHVTLMDVAARPLAAALSEVQSQRLLAAWATLPLRFIGGVQFGVITDSLLCPEPQQIIDEFMPEFARLSIVTLMLPWGDD